MYCTRELGHDSALDKHECPHQYLSMGGRVWITTTKQAVLQSCTSSLLLDTNPVHSASSTANSIGSMTWKDYKDAHGEWEWNPADKKDAGDFMHRLWNSAGKQLISYYKET